MPRLLTTLLACALLLPAATAGAALDRPAELERDINFWRMVFSEVTTHQGYVHDNRRLDIVYETLTLPERHSPEQRRRITAEAGERYATILRTLAGGKRSNLSAEERRVLALWGEDADNATLAAAAERVRFQLGQADRFREGLIRSGLWADHIERTLAEAGVPREVIALPHVESAFNPAARSHAGAAGLWQFMPSTGRRFMQIDHILDERMDPFRATEAAAQLLRHNHSVTGTWPTAISAYNHGAAGIQRAIRETGTDDIARIVREYNGRAFGFASRNFYVSFLAAVDVRDNAEQYFGNLQRLPSDSSPVLVLPAYAPVADLSRQLGVDTTALARLNPAVGRSVWDGSKHLPRGYRLRLPARDDLDPQRILAAAPAALWHDRQTPDLYHVVRSGETLSSIAPRYGTSVHGIVAANGLSSAHRIRVGQRLILPGAEQPAPTPAREETPVRVAAAPAPRVDEEATRVAAAPAPRVDEEAARVAAAPPPRVDEEPLLLAAVRETSAADDDAMLAGEAAPASRIPLLAAMNPPAQDPETPRAPGRDAGATARAVAASLVHDHEDTLAALTADPNDYSVASDGTIRVYEEESLGHYAHWLNLPTSELRRANGLSFGDGIRAGARLRLDFSRASEEEFERRRIAHHQAIQEAFFGRHRIAATTEHVIRSGESVWVIAERRYGVPLWLLRQYNPDLDFASLRPGTRVVVPRLEYVDA